MSEKKVEIQNNTDDSSSVPADQKFYHEILFEGAVGDIISEQYFEIFQSIEHINVSTLEGEQEESSIFDGFSSEEFTFEVLSATDSWLKDLGFDQQLIENYETDKAVDAIVFGDKFGFEGIYSSSKNTIDAKFSNLVESLAPDDSAIKNIATQTEAPKIVNPLSELGVSESLIVAEALSSTYRTWELSESAFDAEQMMQTEIFSHESENNDAVNFTEESSQPLIIEEEKEEVTAGPNGPAEITVNMLDSSVTSNISDSTASGTVVVNDVVGEDEISSYSASYGTLSVDSAGNWI